jgi:hypothetical protein
MRTAITVLAIIVALIGIVSPFIADAHHWMPRRRKNKRP